MTKRILITGANKGIGLATVEAVLAEPNTFVWLGARDVSRGNTARQSIIERSPALADRVRVLELDVASDDSVATAASRVASEHGPGSLYGIVNNAGIGLGSTSMRTVLNVNTLGPKRVFDAFEPLLASDGRVVNVSSASGPNFVASCNAERQAMLTSPDVSWSHITTLMDECLALAQNSGRFDQWGLGTGDAYGLSKALLNAYTIALARTYPERTINACTPGFIETDLTRPYAEARNVSPTSMGMKSPAQGTKATLHLLFGTPGGSGWYFGSDAVRSPLDRYRSPGDPPYAPEA